MRTRATRAAVVAALALAATTAAGCGGSSNATVHGKVTHQGKAVVWGTVILLDDRGTFHQGDIDLSGNYKIEKVPAGRVRIGVTSPNPEPPGGRGGGGGKAGGKAGGGLEDPREAYLAGKTKTIDERPRPPAGAWFPLPPKFLDPMTSDLAGDVKAGTSELNIDVK